MRVVICFEDCTKGNGFCCTEQSPSDTFTFAPKLLGVQVWAGGLHLADNRLHTGGHSCTSPAISQPAHRGRDWQPKNPVGFCAASVPDSGTGSSAGVLSLAANHRGNVVVESPAGATSNAQYRTANHKSEGLQVLAHLLHPLHAD